jgi:hypothetical protein
VAEIGAQDAARTSAGRHAAALESNDAGFDLSGSFDQATLDADGAVVYAMDAQLRLSYFNPAWRRFAADNGGTRLLLRYGPGTPVLDAIAGPLRAFYARAFAGVLETGRAWHHDYECSSAEVYRVFHQTVYPLAGGRGLVVVNSLRVDSPMALEGRRSAAPEDRAYRDDDGLITQCSHCRRVQRPRSRDLWDWVPAWVADMPGDVSHGLCPFCYDFYYKYSRLPGATR